MSATTDVSGVYVGNARIDGLRAGLGLVLHQREARGRILAVVLGGGDELFIENAAITADGDLAFDLVAGGDRIQWSGRVNNAGALHGSTGPGGASRFRPFSGVVDERRLIFALAPTTGEPMYPTFIALALGPDGDLLGGFFNTTEGCGLTGCRGVVTRFSEVDDNVQLSLSAGGECATRATLQATFDNASLIYSGTAQIRDCDGSRTESIIGVRNMRTNSADAVSVLAAIGTLADDLESNAPLGATHPSFASDYLDTGRTQAMLLAGFNDEQARYSNIEADFDRVRGLYTIVDPTALPQLLEPRGVGVLFDERRTGVPVGSVGRDVIVDSVRHPGLPLLEDWGVESGRWVIRGDQSAALDLPFDYTVGVDAIEIATPGGTIYASHGAYGAHFFPHTGHLDGDPKANLVGFFTASDADPQMVELIGDGDGEREDGELWGYFGGAAGELIRNRRPIYVAPLAGTLTRVSYLHGPSIYFDNEPHWEFELAFNPQVQMLVGHVGRLSSVVRDRVLAATGIDTDTYAGPPGDIYDDGGITIAAGEALAFPQVLAVPLPAPYSSYYVGEGTFLERPWAQIEYKVIGPVRSSPGNAQVCAYEMLLPSVADALQTALDNQMADPDSQRFASFAAERWQWAAEGRLCNAFSPLPDDFEGLDTRFGGWFERSEPGTTRDELVSFVHIAKQTAAYDPALYETGVDYLIARLRAYAAPFIWPLPGGGSVDVIAPTGEILSLTDNALLVKWRDLPGGLPPLYQWASYLLGDRGLNIAWGDVVADPGAGVPPPIDVSTPCDDTTVICYNHEFGIPGL